MSIPSDRSPVILMAMYAEYRECTMSSRRDICTNTHYSLVVGEENRRLPRLRSRGVLQEVTFDIFHMVGRPIRTCTATHTLFRCR
jgi:hypothetical protein